MYDNENYQYVVDRLYEENSDLKDRVEEFKRMITRYDLSIEQWKSIQYETSITKDDIA